MKCEHLLQCVVEERRAEANIVSGVETHLELAGTLLLGWLFVENLSVLLRLGSVTLISDENMILIQSRGHTSRRM